MLKERPKRYRYPAVIISHCIWSYHRFNLSYRDIEELMAARGLAVSYETIRQWCLKFSRFFSKVLRKREVKRGDKWHLDEMVIRVNGVNYILWRAVDSVGYELELFIQRRRDKKSALRFIKRLLSKHAALRVVVTDKLRSYCPPIKTQMPKTTHRRHKGLNNRAENSHQPTRRREKIFIKMKAVPNAQSMLSLMGLTRNLFAVDVGRYSNTAAVRKQKLNYAFETWG